MNRDQKAAVVEELAEQIRAADTIFAVDYRGISVSDAADLRTRLRDAETRFRVVKNSLTERATDKAGADGLKPMLEGPTALAFVSGDAALAAKALNDAARSLGTLGFKGGLMDGALLTADDVRALARLPARDVLHAQLVGTIAAPLSGLVRTLNALIAGLAIQLQQVAEQELVSGEAPPTSEAQSASEEAEPSPASEAPSASDTEGEAAASGASASDADETPQEPQAEEAEAPAAEAEAEPAAETSEETDTEAASDAESSEA
jgi:large subunit ribosomal protein L10